MAKTIESWTITVGYNAVGNNGAQWGYALNPVLSTGYGSIDHGDSKFFGGATLNGIYYNGTVVVFAVYGHFYENSGWDTLIINGTSYARTSLTLNWRSNASSALCPETAFYINTSNPFTTTVGATNYVYLQHSGNGVPCDYESISLDQIHQYAGGSSGTLVTINDADVRGKSWYGNVYGSTPVSGATQDFADYYFPRWAKPTWTYRPASYTASSATASGATQYYAVEVIRDTVHERTGTLTGSQLDGTTHYIQIKRQASTNKTTIQIGGTNWGSRLLYAPSGSSSTSSDYWLTVCELDEAFDLVSLSSAVEASAQTPYCTPGATCYHDYYTDLNEPDDGGLVVDFTHLSTNSNSTFVTMADNTWYGRGVTSEGGVEVNVDWPNNDNATGESRHRVVFKFIFDLVKYPTSTPTNLKKQRIEVSLKIDHTTLLDVFQL